MSRALASFYDLRAGEIAATVISRLETYIAARVSEGFTVIGMTIPHCGENSAAYPGLIPVGFNAKADTINAALRANTALAALVDVAADTKLNNYLDPVYRSEFDELHWTPFAGRGTRRGF